MDEQTCIGCGLPLPVPLDGPLVVCPRCQTFIDDDTSVLALDTIPEIHDSPRAGPIPVVLRLPGVDLGETLIVPRRDLSERPTENISPPEPAVGARGLSGTAAAGGSGRWIGEGLVWQLVLTYASIMTLLALYLAWQHFVAGPQRDLLDLPDLAPPAARGGRVTTLIYVPATTPLSRLHVLRLGESRRFGSVRVTALGVSRGPLEFRYFEPREDLRREPSRDVLRLHLQFENVSADQTFTALDRQLVFAREGDPRNPDRFKANNILRPTAAAAGDSAGEIYMYDLSPDSSWVVVNQNLDEELAPGRTVETFIPSDEAGIDQLTGHLAWRFHFRKGYNSGSLRGVTTLAEVRFDASEIQVEPASTSECQRPVPPCNLCRRSEPGDRGSMFSLP